MELDHIFHPAHKLAYKNLVESSDKYVVCAACLDEISSEHYGCGDCNFFLHESCAQLPSELAHSLHPPHPLFLLPKVPYDSGHASCDDCGQRIQGFIYHCGVCKFDLHSTCIFPGESKLNHACHPHALTFKTVVEKPGTVVVCAACLGDISGRSTKHYSCLPCKFFLHKLCAERPPLFTHSLHIMHPLQLLTKSPYPNEDAQCDGCKKRLEGFVYHCEICKFDLDFVCTFPDGWRVNHICHPDHRLTLENRVKKADKGLVCAACVEEILGPLTDFYSCRPCKFFLHKLCAQQPPSITHPWHTSHPLQLLPKNPYTNKEAICDACVKKLEGFVYHCKFCDFDVDFICGFPEGPKLNHICHPDHKLTREYLVKRADKGVVCAACLEEISGPLADYFSCRPCNFFLHRLCSQRPLMLSSSFHPQHRLMLLPKDPYEPGACVCYVCKKQMKGFVYVCSPCGAFAMDFKCAFPEPEKRIQNFAPLHHHPLIFQPRPAKFNCDICSLTGGDGNRKGDDEDQAYLCSRCDFYIHKKCAYIALTQRYNDHQHPLALVQGVPEDLQIYDFLSCDVCKKAVSREEWVSHCDRCRYFVHIRCMVTGDTNNMGFIKDDVDYLEDSFIQLLLKNEEFVLVNWPPRDISSEVFQTLLLKKYGIVMDGRPKIRHISHKEHDMILFQELRVNTDIFFEEEDEEIMCNACVHPITAPYYCCQECNYYLHSACANLPTRIKHFSHDHELKLGRLSRFYRACICDRCNECSNGFFYECRTCKFHLDLTCAALPGVMMHETHEHPLFQMEAKDEGLCYACHKRTENGGLIFKCKSCDVYLTYKCAVLHSGSIRHRWDREHPILLRFPPHGDHPDHFMCDMCEELVHPRHWLYSCFRCDISFHTECVPRYQKYPNMMFGGKLKITSHPHILKYLGKPTLKNICDKCGCKLDFEVFECETCYDCFCNECAEIN